ncbi:3-dehydroquinate synthase [bacterium BFN5]|nr:3-dehydroquinate synthase [bacterium BFN5]
MDDVNINLGNASYTIHIDHNGLDNLRTILQKLTLSGKVLIVSDEHVGHIYGQRVCSMLAAAGFEASLFLVKPGEETKSLDVANTIFTKAITMGLDRKSPIIALGGGVVGDLTGFIAATYLRGIPFIQLPTSLLAQVDSSVGGKVAVNHALGKNLIGAFYQPKTVIIDLNTLATLPMRELFTGLAEVIKYGLIADRNFFTYLQDHCPQILNRDSDALRYIIKRSCEIKASVVEQDERESSLRMILNFGHTIGHAIEANAGYGKYNHGEAVAIGMIGAALISYYLNLCSKDLVEAVRHIVSSYQLPLKASDCSAQEMMNLLTRDKKSIGGKIHWVLLNSIGETSIHNDVPDEIVYKVLTELT